MCVCGKVHSSKILRIELKCGKHFMYQVVKHNYFKSRKERLWQESQRQSNGYGMFSVCFFPPRSLRILAECLSAFWLRLQVFVCCLFPRKHIQNSGKINEFDCARLLFICLIVKIPEEVLWHLLSIPMSLLFSRIKIDDSFQFVKL